MTERVALHIYVLRGRWKLFFSENYFCENYFFWKLFLWKLFFLKTIFVKTILRRNNHLSEGAGPLYLGLHRGEGVLGTRLDWGVKVSIGFCGEALLLGPRSNASPMVVPLHVFFQCEHHFEEECSPGLGRRCFLGREWTPVFDDFDPSESDSVPGSEPFREIFLKISNLRKFRKFAHLLLNRSPFSCEAEVFVEHKLCRSN